MYFSVFLIWFLLIFFILVFNHAILINDFLKVTKVYELIKYYSYIGIFF